MFLDKLTDVFQERHHGALVSSISLINECLATGTADQFLTTFRQSVPQAIRMLKGLVLSASTQDHDVGGIADPFLQVRLLQFFTVVAKDSPSTSEAVNDILAQVATNTEGSKNVGSSILYECARTIFAIHADEGLKNLGINILARFLTSTKDNNLRYVALSTLLRVYTRDPEAVQRHQATIIDCLKDVDLSIRQRALELTVALIDTSSVRILVPDLLAYLGVCGDEMRSEVTVNICNVIEKQAPTPEWRVEMSLRTFKVAKTCIQDEFATRFIAHITNQSQSTQAQAVQSLWEELSLPFDAQMQGRHAMLIASIWSAGEFCDLLVNNNGGSVSFAEQVASCVYGATCSSNSNIIKQYGLTSLAKIVAKFPATAPLVSSAFEMMATSLDCEIQQRACEYATMLESFADLAKFSLAPIPAITVADEPPPTLDGEIPTSGGYNPSGSNGAGAAHAQEEKVPTMKADLFDDLFAPPPPSSLQMPTPTTHHAPAAMPTKPSPQSSVDDLFGPGPSQPPPPVHQPPPRPPPQNDMFEASPKPAPFTSKPMQPPQRKKVEVFRGADLSVSISLKDSAGPSDFSKTTVECDINALNTTLTKFSFLAAVPKTTTVNIKPLLSTTISPAAPLKQELVIDSSNDANRGKTLLLKVRLVYTVNGAEKVEQFNVSQDTASLLA